MPNVVITLNVQANTLWNLTSPTPAQVDSCCSLSDDNNGNSPNGTIEDFTSQVYLAKNVRWVGVSDDNNFTVAIDSITYEAEGDDVNAFDTTIVTGSGGRSGNVNANVRNDSTLVNHLDDYLISFSIYDSPSNFKSFSIDPKLAINP